MENNVVTMINDANGIGFCPFDDLFNDVLADFLINLTGDDRISFLCSGVEIGLLVRSHREVSSRISPFIYPQTVFTLNVLEIFSLVVFHVDSSC